MFDPPQVAASMIPAKSQPWLHPEARPPGCRWLRAAITRLVATSTMAVLKWLMVQKFAEQQLIGRICLPFLRRFIYLISRLLWDLPFPVAHCQMLWNLNWSGHRIGYACEDSCKHSWKSLFKKKWLNYTESIPWLFVQSFLAPHLLATNSHIQHHHIPPHLFCWERNQLVESATWIILHWMGPGPGHESLVPPPAPTIRH